ncbi:MAG: diguanylate cyclase [Acidobacteriota bacterium]|nr:diguanylate cyclase [Acidobacteriota bacterium]
MKSLPIAARIYVAAGITLGAVLLVIRSLHLSFPAPLLFLTMLVLSSLTSALKVNLPLDRSGSTMSVSYAVDFASLLLLGPDQTMLVAAVSAWTQCSFRMKDRNPAYRTLFSMAALVITVQAAGVVYAWLGGVPGHLAGSSIDLARPLVGAATTYFVLNTALVASAIGLSTRQSPLKVWNENFLWSAPSYFVGAGAAAIASAVIDRSTFWLAPLAVAPLYLTYRTYKVYLARVEDEQRHVRQISDLHLATIEALALAIDAKDQTAQTHIRRVQSYAAGLARAMGMPENEIQGVKTAALLHDIGKLAVPEHILSKPGPLTQEEFQKIRIHPQVGAEIIGAVPFPYPVAPLILSHHERWDGKGYPAGLAAEQIPLGARILAVVDYFDALMSERPYHKAMTFEATIGLLRQEAGRALDPTLVRKFIELYPQLNAEAEAAQEPSRRLSLEAGHSDTARPAAGFLGDANPPVLPPTKNVFDDIALAHRELYALYELAQALGSSLGVSDTMSLISSKLSNIVPFSCCALFLFKEETQALQCRFATGVDADIVQQINVRAGHGLVGWVGRNRRPLVNGRPAADLEATSGVTATATALQAALVCPLVFNERLIGTLAVYHTTAGIYTDDHRRLLDRICEQAAAVIYNSIVFEQTQEDSLTDPLTGLPNMRFMFMHLSRELARAERLKSEVSLLVMDLDNFKEINDTYGHHTGDRALRAVAGVLRTAIRPYDICVRYAGDEFIVVLSGCGADEAERKRVELQKAVEDMEFDVRPGRRLPLGMSVGAAVFPHDGEVYEMLLATADGRMYRDKARRKRTGDSRPAGAGGDTAAAVEIGEPAADGAGPKLERAASGLS